MKRRALIVAMSVGGGHGRAGECVAAALRELAPEWEVRCIDLRDHAVGWFRWFYVAGYLFMIRHLPWLWRYFYSRPPRKGGGTLPPWVVRTALRPFLRLVREFEPEVIVATQITASEAAADLVRRGEFDGVAATVVTDFDAHPSWRTDHIHRFFVPDEALCEAFAKTGIAPDRMEATGVPIDPAFEGEFDTAAIRERRGLRPGVPVVFLMGGSLGLGALEDAARELVAAGDARDVVVVAGHNDRLRRSLEALEPSGESRLVVLGFIDFVPELMAVSDVFVSKPGGLSMTEAVTMGVPTLVVAPLAGQERANARHLEEQGVVQCLGPDEAVAPAVEGLLGDAETRHRLSSAARAYAHRGSARRIAQCLLELAGGRSRKPEFVMRNS